MDEVAGPALAVSRRAGGRTDLFWRVVYRCGFPLARLWWGVRRPRHEGALVAIHVGPAVLLVRASYRRAWAFPGGGIRPGETPEQAARRELREELDFAPPPLDPAGVIGGNWDGRRERVHFFRLRLERLPELRLDNREIVAARLAPLAGLAGWRLTGAVAAYLAANDAAVQRPSTE